MQCVQCSAYVEDRATHCPHCGSATPISGLSTETDRSPLPRRSRLEFAPGYIFASRYTIVEAAGEGGMGVVYKAIDTALDQVVALKLIRPELVQIPGIIQRFKKEVRLARQISHPNVCRVHDLGESQGIPYLSMEWISGETLRQLLKQAGMLKQRRALEVAERLTRALHAAHVKGIIHRDLKPGNIMLDDRGEVIVLDFGLAIMRGSEDVKSARSGAGTPGYMAPEQRRRQKVDARTDLFALGLILYEMLTGKRLEQAKPIPAELELGIDKKLLPIVKTLLAERKEERYASAEAAGDALRQVIEATPSASITSYKIEQERSPKRYAWRWGGVAALLIVGALAYTWFWPPDDPSGRSALEPPSAAQVYYERGLHYLREESESLRSLDDAIQMLQRAVKEDPNFALAWACLGEAYWKRYERKQETSSRNEAIQAVGMAFHLKPDLPEAHNARGTGLLAEGDFEAAQVALEKAVHAGSSFDIAWANLGNAYTELGNYSAGLRALQTAIDLQPGSFRNHIFLGLFYDHFAEYDEAEKAYRRAIELKPDSLMAWNNLGTDLLQTGRPEEAVGAFLRSLEIEERALARSNLGTAYYFQGKYEEAVKNYQRATVLEPSDAVHWGNLGDGLKMLDREEEAHEAYVEAVRHAKKALAASPLSPERHMDLGHYCARAREEECALSEGARAAELQPENVQFLFRNAVIRCLFGRQSDALDWLERAVKLGLSKAEIENEPGFSTLREIPRYQGLLELAS